ncbi:hypothetical protein [Flavobacterium laiguense]|uniref:Uncharacterized protein n=1 Tax=Flavobacterium laiguense TaxID=2169409 RepID=A0A2U1JWZ6_9FLAO|nr:hypothetical protein [Flavobacterium laiguense]PWA09515.1 hypothetical protein DB891_07480 [Flavobacterium laiguense]
MEEGLKNPALVAYASSEHGQKTIAKSTDLAFLLLKIGLIGGLCFFAYYKIFMGFKKREEDNRYKPSKISTLEAKARAEAIYTAMMGFGANYATVEKNLTGLNYNGFIRLYNAFGERRSSTLSKMDLVEWLQDQFKEEDISKLRFLIQGFF